MKSTINPYYLGLDCGTNSVGFAVTDENYNLLKAQNKDMWGSHLFDEAQTAEARRIQRNARKRLGRRKERIKLLQAIFAEEMYKIDPTFFLRLNESSLYVEDRSSTNKQKFSLFNDKNYTDKDFKKEYPTIFHLRKALINGTAKHDPRLVYLALHSILKNRGHFLFPGESFASTQDITPVLTSISEAYSEIFANEDDEVYIYFTNEIQEILKTKNKRERTEQLGNAITIDNESRKKLIISAIVGNKVKPAKLFDNEEYKELPDIEFKKASFEETDFPVLEASLYENEYKLIEAFKVLYDWALLANIMENEAFISFAKVNQYERNKADLAALKRIIRKYAPDQFETFFHTEKYFSSYIGSINTNKLKTSKRVKRSSIDDFYKDVKKILEKADETDEDVIRITQAIKDDSFFILLRSYRNGVIPYQVNKAEMEQILAEAQSFMPWLSIPDEDGITPKEKILSLMKFRIPYYVGPLVDESKNKNAWMERNESGKIYPWNFNKKVNEAVSAEKFILRMTNKCTYCIGEDVIPKSSLLYQSYMVLNEINNIRINGEPITVKQKQTIYTKLFLNGNVTPKKIISLATTEGWYRKGEDLVLSGIDQTIKANLSSYIAFREYLENGKLTQNDVEIIIKWLTLFSDGGNIAKNKTKDAFKGKLSDKEIDQISRMKFSGWGNFSSKFLTGIEATDPETGEVKNIIRLLWDTNMNLMEIIHNPACDVMRNLENKEPIRKLNYKILEDLRVSPKVKRQIWQALKIVKEIEQIMGHAPAKVFIEMTREKQDSGRTKSRKESLLEKIETIDKPEILKQLNYDPTVLEKLKNEDEKLISKRDKLYLYYTQLGKCMYSGEPIDLEDLLGSSLNYDIDHIYPYSKSSDDSLENKVIVKSSLNRRKTDVFPINENIRIKMTPYWKALLEQKLISPEKYKRLTRSTPLTDADTNSFINRQIVETSQSTLALAKILERYYGDSTRIIYSKARRVSEFRDTFKIIKSRTMNELHHAQDAYLNIVVGNALHTKYTMNWFLKNPNFNDPYKFNIPNAWITTNDESIKTVKETLARNTILFTRQPEMKTGQLFDLNPKAKGSEKGMIPLKLTPELKAKLNDEEAYKAWTDKYGGYNSLAISHFALIKHIERKKTVYSFIRIPVIRAQELLNKDKLLKHCVNELKLQNPEIIKTRILINTLLIVDGFPMTISNCMNGGATIGLKSAVPLYLSSNDIQYLKYLENYDRNCAAYKNYEITPQYDLITKEGNESFYSTLVRKSMNATYQKRPANLSEVLRKGFGVFKELSLEEQARVLLNILNYFKMSSGLTNLAAIGGSKAQGTYTNSSKIDPSKKNVKLIFQSITGIYEEVLELK